MELLLEMERLAYDGVIAYRWMTPVAGQMGREWKRNELQCSCWCET